MASSSSSDRPARPADGDGAASPPVVTETIRAATPEVVVQGATAVRDRIRPRTQEPADADSSRPRDAEPTSDQAGFDLATAGDEPEEKEPRTCSQRLDSMLLACISFITWLLSIPSMLHESLEECMKNRLDRWEVFMEGKQEAVKMSATTRVLRSMAAEDGLLPATSLLDRIYMSESKQRKLEEECAEVNFTSEEVVQAFSRAKRNFRQPLFIQVMQGHAELKPALPILICQAVLLILCLVAFHCMLASIVFSTSRSVASDDSGALLDLQVPSLAAAAAGSTVKLQPLWDFPLLSFQELRQVEDIVFTHDHVAHSMTVATVAKTAAGDVVLRSADGSTVRIEPDGRAYWGKQRAVGSSAEVYLLAMQQLREMIGGSSEGGGMNWLTAGSLSLDVLLES
mmetsp:Transcript_19737/g.35066  ORF Transcript_19737/g.35066 Transcript_19737/m.35066 type:complete len:398 (-) Transcript_19737:184-1377(-)|eukprot:CAMPEP_0197624492 /NCGR_PEP_ID=MMETSP1338-20131121/4102_1 /TAXON_ID=43686 ORGANISM="Pelagodinium beii, Strain RCC1491" /NCGR_SAMPLE_ID=MMETSP1338 /ASSEMBLY_ACC=CAM_ASM_000754 /LENGTH=397 /DNA_ID=CAMNT_0043194631 /DNA_START=89 /DNA_END=1282 /DNA_ORIENTATION=+